jgi:hypothetical protein
MLLLILGHALHKMRDYIIEKFNGTQITLIFMILKDPLICDYHNYLRNQRSIYPAFLSGYISLNPAVFFHNLTEFLPYLTNS